MTRDQEARGLTLPVRDGRVYVEGEPWEPGCYLDGHHGQYLLDEVARMVADVTGDVTYRDEVYAIRDRMYAATTGDEWNRAYEELGEWIDGVDEMVELLNSRVEGGYFDFEDGEFFLVRDDDEGLWLGVNGRLVDRSELWTCEDCYVSHHYGAREVAGEWYAGESDSPADREPWGLVGDELDVSDWTNSESGEGMEEFSSRSCQACGSTLAGRRYRFALDVPANGWNYNAATHTATYVG